MQTRTASQLSQISTQLRDAHLEVRTRGSIDDGITAVDAMLADGRVLHVWMDDTDTNVTEWNSDRTRIEMSEARFRGVDAYTVARFVQTLGQTR